jgi:hypothetical protein
LHHHLRPRPVRYPRRRPPRRLGRELRHIRTSSSYHAGLGRSTLDHQRSTTR